MDSIDSSQFPQKVPPSQFPQKVTKKDQSLQKTTNDGDINQNLQEALQLIQELENEKWSILPPSLAINLFSKLENQLSGLLKGINYDDLDPAQREQFQQIQSGILQVVQDYDPQTGSGNVGQVNKTIENFQRETVLMMLIGTVPNPPTDSFEKGILSQANQALKNLK